MTFLQYEIRREARVYKKITPIPPLTSRGDRHTPHPSEGTHAAGSPLLEEVSKRLRQAAGTRLGNMAYDHNAQPRHQCRHEDRGQHRRLPE